MENARIGRYEIISEIGRGGMATVFHAYDPHFERDVAVKVLPRALLHDPQFRKRFEREAKTIASLEHPAIVPVYDFGEDDGQPYIVMRMMSGGTLEDRLAEGALSKEEAARIISRLAPALDVAHAKGIIHRDLKPGNILFDQYGNAFLSDFGIARLTQSASTLTGDKIIGTPSYMSPEQIQGDKTIDGRSDIYSLGVILFQMLTGDIPFKADTPAQVMMKHILEPVPRISEVDPSIPSTLNDVIARTMFKDADARYPTVNELASAFESSLKGELGTFPTQQQPDAGLETILVPPPGQTVLTPTRPDIISPQVRTDTAPPIPARRPTSLTTIILSGIGAVLIGLIVFGGLGTQGIGPLAFLAGPTETPTLLPTQTSLPTEPKTSTPEPTEESGLPDTATPTDALPTPIPTATATEPPVATPTIPPTPTKEIVVKPTVGGADMIALINQNDIWVANVDGTDPVQLTTDGASKFNLQWTPDGQALVYTSGVCAKMVDLDGKLDNIVCFNIGDLFEGFAISPDGKQVAISLNRELFFVPFDIPALQPVRNWRGLEALGTCEAFKPFNAAAVKYIRWSNDMNQMAIVFLGNIGGLQKDQIRVMDISDCNLKPQRLDEFPFNRFDMKGTGDTPPIQNFGWDGANLIGLTSFVRNDGYGDLWIYNTALRKGDKVNPIRGVCCYRDVSWSPDGQYITFAFQDIGLGAASKSQIYYIQLGTLGTGLDYAPLALPEDFLTNPREKPQPVLRPAQ